MRQVQVQQTHVNLDLIIEEGAKLLVKGEDSNWGLARLTSRYTLNHGESNSPKRDPDKLPIKEWAEKIAAKSGRRFSHHTAKRYKALWKKHEDDDLNQISFYDALSDLIKEESSEQEEEEVKAPMSALAAKARLEDKENGVAAKIKSGKVVPFPVTPKKEEEDEETYHVVTSKQRSTDPELEAILAAKEMSEAQLILVDAVQRLRDTVERAERGKERFEELGISQIYPEGFDKRVVDYVLDMEKGLVRRAQELLTYHESIFGY